MKTSNTKFYKSFYPIGINNEKLYVQMGNKIGYLDSNFKFTFLGYVPEKNILFKVLNYFSLTRRILRLGCSDLIILADEILVFYRRKLYKSLNKEKLQWELAFSGFKGSRPLNPGENGKELVFGEYFSNKNRDNDVKVFSYNKQGIKLLCTFKKGTIRHVHGCIFDSYNFRWIVCTGDYNFESGIYYIQENQATKIAGGSQAFRAVDIIIKNENEIIIPSDTPLEKNFIRLLNVKSGELRNLFPVEGSVFHSKKIGDLYLITTVTEPSIINNTSHAIIYASIDGLNWKKLTSFSKDIFPIGLQKYTRYTELKVLDKLFIQKYIVIEARATKHLSHGTIFIPYHDIVSYLTFHDER